MANSQELDQFLNMESSQERARLLENWQKSHIGLPDFVIQTLMDIRASEHEIGLGFESCLATNQAEFELWVMREFLNWNQNIAAAALRAWARTTERILWHRLIPVLALPELPQRIRYTILELAPLCHGFEITRATIGSAGWEELSPAFHALLLERGLQFDIHSERLVSLSRNILRNVATQPHPEHKAIFTAYAYLLRHGESEANTFFNDRKNFIWADLLESAHEAHSRRKAAFSKLEKQASKEIRKTSLSENMPPMWSRDQVPELILAQILSHKFSCFDALAGVPRSSIQNAAQSVSPNSCWADLIISHLPLQQSPSHLVTASHFSRSYDNSKYPLLADARLKACAGQLAIAGDKVNSVEQFFDPLAGDSKTNHHPIMDFFFVLHGRGSIGESDHNVWTALARAWQDPATANIGTLSTLCRKQKGLLHLGFIKLMSRMTGRDEAVLKLLDYIRSDDETLLRAVVHTLASINTPRSHLELISMITRPNSTLLVQQDIALALARKDLRDLQKELRSAVQDLKTPVNLDHPLSQIRDELSALIAPIPDISHHNNASPAGIETMRSENLNLDQELNAMIPNYKVLSSEVKRALRTALFFNKTAAVSQHADSIDLSPLIDMQYKAMELLFREFFEDMVSQSLQSGVIQRKLDVLGYARPIVRQMDEFEGYIASLPVVRDIPFFSKFKLRKMLRAICQFEPGRRFTLDGLKAFGLYFLIFGRRNCTAGLANTLNTGASDDRELAELCKELHVFQDFRNRAAHEGFHPDASNDIQGIWRTSASVVQWAFKIKNAQKSDSPMGTKKAS
jgi:hypothetical protein